MKLILSILLVITTNGFAQINFHVMSANDYPNGVEFMVYENGDTVITVVGDSLSAIKLLFKAWKDATQYDSTKYYWKKKVYWEGRMNKELERLNKGGHANDISKALVRYQDSAIRYKILLDKLKSK